jgi:hypothetical protein
VLTAPMNQAYGLLLDVQIRRVGSTDVLTSATYTLEATIEV